MSEQATQDVETSTPKPPSGRRGGRLARYALAFFTVVIVIDAVVGEKGLLALMHARAEYERLEADINHVRAENARLREEARQLREEPDAIEDVARRELGLIKPGETVFIIRDRPAGK
jgi:cell division protein FtsB